MIRHNKLLKTIVLNALITCFFLTSAIPVSAVTQQAASVKSTGNFIDVPANSDAYKDIYALKALGITNGIVSNKFGYRKTISRGEFITYLVRLMKWQQISPAKSSFIDNQNKYKYYYKPIETAISHGTVIKESSKFRPEAPITREDMAVMIVRCLGYGNLAERLNYLGKPYSDVTKNLGYISIAKDCGIISKTNKFSPNVYALKEQAASMLMNMYNRLNSPIKDLNGFYAIKSSSQKDKINSLTSVSFGWSSLCYDNENKQIVLNDSYKDYGYNDFYLPEGFSDRLTLAKQNNASTQLMVFASQETKVIDKQSNINMGLIEYILTKPDITSNVIDNIVSKVNLISLGEETGSFDGVVIDFECMKGETLKQAFNKFLEELRQKLGNKKLFVMVHPKIGKGLAYYNGYDYKKIGSIADKVILMAHDYNAKNLTSSEMTKGWTTTPLTPFEDIYYALKSITDANQGVQDKSKIMLQISFDWVSWKVKGGKNVKSTPDNYSYENFLKLFDKKITPNWSELYKNPYIKFTDSSTGVQNTVWYEDSRSVLEKVKLAKMFGIQGISLWRLGQIPDYIPSDGRILYQDVWQKLLGTMR